jgi:hypothetical protein
MILFNGKIKIVQSREFPIAAGSVVNAEGQAVVQAFENGVEVVKPSLGSSGEKFMGFTYGPVFTPVVKSLVEDLVVPASGAYTVTLMNEPLAGQLFIKDLNTGTVQSLGDPANANEYSISGKVVTFNSGNAGHAMFIQYRYSPTSLEVLMNDKMMITTMSPVAVINSIGVIQQGEVWTDQFNAAVDFASATALKMNAGGIITDQTGSGSSINGIITHVPDISVPYLGIRFDVL